MSEDPDLRGLIDPTVTAIRSVVPSSRSTWTVASCPGAMPISRPRTEYVSCPVRRCVSADSPVLNWSGRTPIPTRFCRWIRSNDSASTNRTPRRAGPFAAQSRDDPLPYSLPASTPSGVPSAR